MIALVRPLLVASIVFAAACGGDEGTGPNGGAITATIDGQSWNGSLAVQATHSSNVLAIGGVNNAQQQIMITIPGVSAPGTFTLGAGQGGIAQVVIGTTQAWTTSMVGGTGTVTVTELNANGAKGTFSFTGIASPGTSATGTKAVTNGSFDVEF